MLPILKSDVNHKSVRFQRLQSIGMLYVDYKKYVFLKSMI